jgi:hypothetical protein
MQSELLVDRMKPLGRFSLLGAEMERELFLVRRPVISARPEAWPKLPLVAFAGADRGSVAFTSA